MNNRKLNRPNADEPTLPRSLFVKRLTDMNGESEENVQRQPAGDGQHKQVVILCTFYRLYTTLVDLLGSAKLKKDAVKDFSPQYANANNGKGFQSSSLKISSFIHDRSI